MAHHDIVSVLETIRAGAIADALLAFLELFKQAEVARDWVYQVINSYLTYNTTMLIQILTFGHGKHVDGREGEVDW